MATTLQQIRNRVREYTSNDGRIDDNELKRLEQEFVKNGKIALDDGYEVDWNKLASSLKAAVQSGEPLSPDAAAGEKLTSLFSQVEADTAAILTKEGQLQQLEQAIKEAEQKQAKKQKLVERKQILEAELNAIKGRLQGALTRAKALAKSTGRTAELRAAWFKAADMPPPKGMSKGTFTSTSKAMTAGGGAKPGQPGGGAKAAGFAPPAGWGGSAPGAAFSSDAYLRSLSTDNLILDGFTDVLKNQNRGKQLMMLFYYFAQRAASGDLGQMYQFLKFLTYIISKDKAKQQIDMGRKLIELQDESRRVTDILMNTRTDAADPNSNNDFMKTMTWAKSQSDAVATSQKLIAQMMEEFATIVETLTNSTKGALEAWSRVLRTTSQMR